MDLSIPLKVLCSDKAAIPQAQLPKTIKIIISLKQLLGWELITGLFPFLTCYLKSSLVQPTRKLFITNAQMRYVRTFLVAA